MCTPPLVLHPALFAQLTAALSALAAALSIALTYAWQSKWRLVARPPFISDAHYDDLQSPIFAATTTLTSASAATTVLLVYLATRARLGQSAACASEDSGAGRRCCWSFPARVRGRVGGVVALVAAGAGVVAAGLLATAAAVSAKLGFHFVAIAGSFVATVVWACGVSVTLGGRGQVGDGERVAAMMQLCATVLSGVVVGLVVMHPRNLVVAAVLEYAVVGLSCVFLVLLSVRLKGARIVCSFEDCTRLIPVSESDGQATRQGVVELHEVVS